MLAAPAPGWRLTRSPHFEIYAQSSDQRARALLTWFEQLRAFFEQQRGWKAGSSPPVRVIVFASEQEYQPYRLRSASDAYYVGSGSQDYIVMSTDDPARFGLAAHEYAHLVLRASTRTTAALAEGGPGRILRDASYRGVWHGAGRRASRAHPNPAKASLDSVAGVDVALRNSATTPGTQRRGFVLRGKLGADRYAGALSGVRARFPEVSRFGRLGIPRFRGVTVDLRQIRGRHRSRSAELAEAAQAAGDPASRGGCRIRAGGQFPMSRRSLRGYYWRRSCSRRASSIARRHGSPPWRTTRPNLPKSPPRSA